MATIDDRTSHRNYPKPNPENDLDDDVYRVIEALDGIDLDMKEVLEALDGKSAVGHQHVVGDVTGLQSALNGKAAIDHQHSLNDLSDVDVSVSASGQYLRKVGGEWVPQTPQIAHIDGLQQSLEGKQSYLERNQPNGYAGLDGSGKIDAMQLPAIAITSRSVVNSQSEMLALNAQEGDVAIRADVNDTYILGPGSPTVLANWQKLLSPTANVTSVAGKTGAVSLVVGDVSGAAPAANPTFTGTVTLPGSAGTSAFAAGSGDGGTMVTHNVRLKLHWGLGISDYSNTVRGAYDARTGTWNVAGGYQVNGVSVMLSSGGTFTNDVAIQRNGNPTQGYAYFGNSGARYFGWDGSQFITGGPLNVGGGLTATSGFFTNAVEIQYPNPSLWLHHNGVKRARWVVDGAGALVWQDQGGQNHFFVTGAGRPWFQEFGYVSDQIEARAYAHAVGQASAYANSRVTACRFAGYGESSGMGGMTQVAPAVFTGAAGSAYGAQTFGHRTLQYYRPDIGWANFSVE